MKSRAIILLSLLGLASLAGCNQPKPTSESFNWKGPIAAGEWLRLRNVTGDFDIREGTGDSAEISLTIDRSSAYAPPATIKVLKASDGVLACVLYGDDNTCSATEYEGGNTSRRSFFSFMRGNTTVHGTIVLPRGVKLDATSTNGDITVAAVSADVILTTTNGDIEARGTRGSVNVTTTNGDIDLGIDAIGTGLGITTTNGDVKVELPTTLSAALTMSTTNGELDLGIPGNVTSKSAKQIIATLGAGGTPMAITTTNGDVTLRQRGSP